MVYIGSFSEGNLSDRTRPRTGAFSAPQRVANEIKRVSDFKSQPDAALLRDGSAGEKGGIAAYVRDTRTGALHPLGSCLTGEGPLCHLSLDREERQLFATSYRDGTFFRFALDEAGKPERVGAAVCASGRLPRCAGPAECLARALLFVGAAGGRPAGGGPRHRSGGGLPL
jgi:6-phosphogluconolactonase (cycloisomerase 2 family)